MPRIFLHLPGKKKKIGFSLLYRINTTINCPKTSYVWWFINLCSSIIRIIFPKVLIFLKIVFKCIWSVKHVGSDDTGTRVKEFEGIFSRIKGPLYSIFLLIEMSRGKEAKRKYIWSGIWYTGIEAEDCYVLFLRRKGSHEIDVGRYVELDLRKLPIHFRFYFINDFFYRFILSELIKTLHLTGRYNNNINIMNAPIRLDFQFSTNWPLKTAIFLIITEVTVLVMISKYSTLIYHISIWKVVN